MFNLRLAKASNPARERISEQFLKFYNTNEFALYTILSAKKYLANIYTILFANPAREQKELSIPALETML